MVSPPVYYTLSGTVTNNGTGMTGVPVNFSGAGVATTDSNGIFSIAVLRGYTGVGMPSIVSGTFAPASRSYAYVTANTPDQNYAYGVYVYTVSGTVTSRGLPVSAEMKIGSAQTVIDQTGVYSTTVAYGQAVEIYPSYYTSIPDSYALTNVTANQPNKNFDLPVPALIADNFGTLYWSFAAADPDEWSVAEETSPGVYDGIAALAGATHVFVVPDYNTNYFVQGQSNDGRHNVPLSNVAYAAAPVVSISISGTVLDAYTSSGVVTPLVFSGSGTHFSASSGSYGVSVLAPYTGSIVPTLSGGTFVPSQRVYAGISTNQVGQNFTFYGTTLADISVSGTVTDSNTNAGLQSVAVVFTGSGTATTNSAGYYSKTVANGYSGTATPYYSGGSFAPVNHVYSGINVPQTAQNYVFTGTSSGAMTLSLLNIPTIIPVGVSGTGTVAGSGFTITDTNLIESVLWEVEGQEPVYGVTCVFLPTSTGSKHFEVEALFVDGRRLYGSGGFAVSETANREIEDFVNPNTADLWFSLDGTYRATVGNGTLVPSGTPTFDSTSFVWPSRPTGAALACDGNTDSAAATVSSFYSGGETEITIQCMVYLTGNVDTSVQAFPLYAEARFNAYMGLRQFSGSGGLYFAGYNPSSDVIVSAATTASLLTHDTWHNIALKVDNNGYRAYVNGTLAGTLLTAGAITNWNNTTELRTGGIFGYVDEVVVTST